MPRGRSSNQPEPSLHPTFQKRSSPCGLLLFYYIPARYVSHALICGKIRTLLYAFIKPASEAGVISVYFMALAATIFLLLGIYWVLKRYMPSLLSVLTGRK